MLCQVCASIDLRYAFGEIPDDETIPLHESLSKYESLSESNRAFHYESYAGMLAAIKHCQLCSVVVEGFNGLSPENRPHPSTPIYRSVNRIERHRTLFPNQERLLTTISFGDKNHKLSPAVLKFGLDWCDIELYVEEDTKLAIREDIVGRPVRPAEDPRQLLTWLNQCEKSHEKCVLRLPEGKPQTFMPTRVLDVGSEDCPTLRLRDGNQCLEPYATLSHCWGTVIRSRTTKSTLQKYMQSIDISTLCKTMRDAIYITRNLGIRYLWVDAICIVQDDSEDWEREAMKMSEIYTRSAITIAATSSDDGNGGCFFSRPNEPTAHLLWTNADGSTPEKVSFRLHDMGRYHRLVDYSPLNRRAWVMQERSLSRRIIHYTTERLYWECQEALVEEGFMKMPLEEGSVTGFELASNASQSSKFGDPYFLDTQWLKLVERYSSGQLTYKSDRLPALAGLAQIWATQSKDRYIAGCWQKNLPRSLLWTRRSYAVTKEIPDHPSWSWASLDGGVDFQEPHLRGPTETLVLIKDIAVEINGSTTVEVYGGIDSGSLTLTGRVKATTFQGDRTNNEYDQSMPWTMSTLDAKLDYVHQRASFDREPEFNSPIPMVQLCAYTNNAMHECTELIMLLQPLQHEGHFKRLGLGIITWRSKSLESGYCFEESWFRDAPQTRLTIF